MRAHIHLFGDSGFQIRNSVIKDNQSARLTYLIVNHLKLVRVPSRFKAKAANKAKGRPLTENRGGKGSAFFNKIVGEIVFVDADGDCWGDQR